jgi:hypothetical protein
VAGNVSRSTAIGLILAGGAAAAVLSGCTAPHPAIRSGDANSVEVSYAGDVASALAVARQHCGQFERVPRLVDPGVDLAVFECVRR